MNDSRFMACLSVLVPNSTILAVVNVVALKAWAQLGLIILSIAYTVWRWRKESQKP